MEIADFDLHNHVLSAALNLQFNSLAYIRVEDAIQPDELGEKLVVDLDEDVSLLDLAEGRAVRQYHLRDQQICLLREGCPHVSLAVGA